MGIDIAKLRRLKGSGGSSKELKRVSKAIVAPKTTTMTTRVPNMSNENVSIAYKTSINERTFLKNH